MMIAVNVSKGLCVVVAVSQLIMIYLKTKIRMIIELMFQKGLFVVAAAWPGQAVPDK